MAIVGPSGSGKTTLCNLMARFWDVQGGSVCLGGRDVREYSYDSLIRNFSFVFQRVYLFSDTIANNIRFGKPDASMEEVQAAAKKARCYDFIMALPDGFGNPKYYAYEKIITIFNWWYLVNRHLWLC